MKKLARNWRKSHEEKLSLPTRDDPSLDDSRPLDTEEQEELVRSLERTQAEQSLFWRRVFAGFLFSYAVFQLYSIYQMATSPWELRYQAYFMEDMESWMVISADWVAILVCSMATLGLLHNSKHRRRWIWYSCFTGAILAVFWLYYMLRMSRFRWDAIWLPIGPLSGAGICLYVDHLLNESSEEVRKLRSYMYAFKSS
ncbi:hypothetical protein JCGZ_07328 [Jatropha curcas]|uniref:Uncharacterized protein n=1 Tax=Jatropha curcas TaxID=180498 RepID=A0A067KCB8_JATCU|nr:uncharacterized protein LOC105637800 [Jatropha curcas]KDP33757.1 hypothetical protein JCGZ_07328 [Jatropha curcas]